MPDLRELVAAEPQYFNIASPRAKQDSTWSAFKDPKEDRVWYWNRSTGEWFFDESAELTAATRGRGTDYVMRDLSELVAAEPQYFNIASPRVKQEPTWFTFKDPKDDRVWYWNESTGEWFFDESAELR